MTRILFSISTRTMMACALTAACDGSGSSGGDPGSPALTISPGALLGTWRLTRPGEATAKAELVFREGGRATLKKRQSSSSGPSALVIAIEGTYSVVGSKVTFESMGGSQPKQTISANAAVAGNELAIGIDVSDFVLVPKTASALAPVGSWVSDLSTAKYTATGAIDSSTTFRFDVDIQAGGTMSWTATEESVRSGVARAPSRVVGQGVWQEVSSGRYVAKLFATDSGGFPMRLIGGAIATETAIFVRQ
jgi:hypothetical protein